MTERPEAEEYCPSADKKTRLSYSEARQIALESACGKEGPLKETHFCNDTTGTWWIDLDIQRAGCYPACVVDIAGRTAEINWRCTGAVNTK